MKKKTTQVIHGIYLFFIVAFTFFLVSFSVNVSAAAYVATIASPNQVGAANICSGTTKAPVFGFTIRLDNGTGSPNLTRLKFSITGTYLIAELDSFFLWYNITNDLSSASLVVSRVDSLAPGTLAFPAFTKTLVGNDTSFFWITTNTLQAAAIRTLQITAMDTSNYTMAAGTKQGNTTAGGVQSIKQSVAAPTGNTTQSFCTPPSPTIANLTATGNTIQWYAAASGGSPLLSTASVTNGTHYFASQTVNGCESTSRLDVSATVGATPAAPSGSATQNFCTPPNPTVANLTATGTAIQWYATASGGTALTGATALVNNTHYFATQTVGACESTSRFDVTATIGATPPAPTGSAAQSFCTPPNPTVADLSATGTAIKWYAAATGGSPLSGGTALVNATHYFASQTVGGCESTSRFDVTVTVGANPAAPTGDPTQLFCTPPNPTVADLAATGTNIKWYAAASGGSPLTSATALTNGTHYFATQTVGVNCESLTRFDVTVTINPTPPAPTGTASQTFCSATNPTIADLSATGTSIQWYSTATGGTALAGGTALTNGTHYFATQTVGGCESTSRFDVTVTINPTPSAPTGNASQSFCSVSNPNVGNLLANGSNIQWYANATGGAALGLNTPLTNNTHYFATQTVLGCESTSRFDVTVTINQTPLAPTGNSNQSFCLSSSPTVGNLSASGTAVQWYAASSGGSPLLPGTLLTNSTHYFATQTVNGCESTSRFDVTVTIVTNPAVPTGTSTQSFCGSANATLLNLSANGTAIQWYANPSGGTSLAGNTVLSNNTHYYATQTVNGCESTTRLNVTAFVRMPSANPGNNVSVCAGVNATLSAINIAGGFPPYNVSWNNGAGVCTSVVEGGSCTVQVTPLNNTVFVATIVDAQTCSTTVSQTITVNPLPQHVNVINPVTNIVDTVVCAGSRNINYSLDAIAGSSVGWSSTPASVSIGDTNGINNVVSFPDLSGSYLSNINIRIDGSNGCSNNTQLTVHVIGSSAPTLASIIEKNSGTIPILIYTDPAPKGFRWGYDSVANNKILMSAFFPGQVYQAFVPPPQFLNGTVLDINTYWYWVLVYDPASGSNDTCKTRAYFNGPFRVDQQPVIPDEILAAVVPNPNDGNFNLNLQGNLYGNISVAIYDVLGRQKELRVFMKTEALESFPVNPDHLSSGIYSAVLTGENGEKAIVKFIVKN